MKRLVVLLLFALFCASLPAEHTRDLMRSYSERAGMRYRGVSPRVLAFYYPWYGGQDDDGKYLHWDVVDASAREISESPHYPELGPYDSMDPEVIRRHCEWAKEAGIDGWIVSWWGRGTQSDRAIRPVLDACQKAGLTATVYYETVRSIPSATAAVDELKDVLERFADHPAWQKHRGRPVVFVYGRALNQIGLNGWLEVVTRLSREVSPAPVVIGDQISHPAAAIFDGVHTYNPAGQLRGKRAVAIESWAGETYPDSIETAGRFGKISTLTLVPGYDDTKLDREQAFAVPRYDGNLYRAQWEAALKARPDWILLTSWNEWHEGSEIEPSVEFGHRYMELTRQYAREWRRLPRRGQPPRATRLLSERNRQALRERLRARPVAVLPDGFSRASWFLQEQGIIPEPVSWRDVAAGRVSPASHPVLLYAAGEIYQTSVEKEGDVVAGLRAYLASGGTLAVFPSGPMPFYYSAPGQSVHDATRVGLPLRIGWEHPPATELSLVPADHRLPHVLKYFSFPKEGDLRWRPLLEEDLAWPADYTPLIHLRGEEKDYGDAAALVHYTGGPLAGGRIVYAWFGLFNLPKTDEILYDLFMLAAAED